MSETQERPAFTSPTTLTSSFIDDKRSARVGKIPIDTTSPGVARIEIIAEHITLGNRICIFIGVFLIAFAYGLDGSVRGSYQPVATSKLGNHQFIATLGVLRSIVGAVCQPTAAKVADVFGRAELILVSIFFYIIGSVMEATSTNIVMFAAGATGYTAIILLVEVVIADTTSLRSRVFFSYVPALPFLINTWISGDVVAVVLRNLSWRWGIGMFCILYPVCALPLIVSLWWVTRKAKKSGDLDAIKTPHQLHGGWKLVKALFWQLDVIGIALTSIMLGFILTPLTIAGGISAQWSKTEIILPLAIGLTAIPVWVWWETKAPYPMIPFKLLKDRAVWGALGIAITFNFAFTCQSDFLYSVLAVAFYETPKSATRIQMLYSFVSVVLGVLLGLVVYRVRRLKPFILFGTFLWMVAFGLLIHYRGGFGNSAHAGIIGAQLLLGIGGGFFPYPAQASIQAATKHEHVAAVTGLYLASYSIGAALGNTVSGVVWSHIMPLQLEMRLADTTRAAQWFDSPLELLEAFPRGNVEREAVVQAYMHVQRLVCIVGISAVMIIVFFACVIRNPKLPDTQSMPDAEEFETESFIPLEDMNRPRSHVGPPEAVMDKGWAWLKS
ncbi:siderochrome-iron transporter-like protein Sit1 [Dothidotthia symphoricarpi CBS 119687]|uniref:Siderochrome-iron transporter-like protein Sit1 n=1 Tax=Dothidotthia symphoricarpi CBS 119687 TaxID=1392245 RepID=A0A6A6A8P9_9PLEO|nr:siderochrome-iron transporter-like protein Sit1 [Dothidotthia symphoricarpi CBS 119687]KAF2127021.1 siderochrome-iron transporter-like protein Sit1 [Dothidotthia symphoricarpi CBS 119687]